MLRAALDDMVCVHVHSRAAGRAVMADTGRVERPNVAIPGYQGHRPAGHTAKVTRRTSSGRPW